MVSVAYREAYSEVLDILNHTRKEDVEKIPSQFMEYLRENSSKSYVPKLDHSMSIKDMKLKSKTKAVLAVIYRKFWCDAEQLKQFDEKIKNNQVKYDKYKEEMNIHKQDYDFIFNQIDKSEKTVEKQNINTSVTPYKESFFIKLTSKISRFFGKVLGKNNNTNK